jgi:hypothetical protein
MNTTSKYFGSGQDTDSTNTIDFHFHVWVTVWVT